MINHSSLSLTEDHMSSCAGSACKTCCDWLWALFFSSDALLHYHIEKAAQHSWPLCGFSALLKDISTLAVETDGWKEHTQFSQLVQGFDPATLVSYPCFRPRHQMQHWHVEFLQCGIWGRRWSSLLLSAHQMLRDVVRVRTQTLSFVGDSWHKSLSVGYGATSYHFWPFTLSA